MPSSTDSAPEVGLHLNQADPSAESLFSKLEDARASSQR